MDRDVLAYAAFVAFGAMLFLIDLVLRSSWYLSSYWVVEGRDGTSAQQTIRVDTEKQAYACFNRLHQQYKSCTMTKKLPCSFRKIVVISIVK